MKAWRTDPAKCILTYFLLGKLLCCSEAQGQGTHLTPYSYVAIRTTVLHCRT